MTPRENTLSLYRRTGYRFMPVSFGMCPAVRAKMVDAIGEGVSPGDFYDYPDGFARMSLFAFWSRIDLVYELQDML